MITESKKEMIKLNIAMTYPVSWSPYMVASNFVQNFYDALGKEDFGTGFHYHEENGMGTSYLEKTKKEGFYYGMKIGMCKVYCMVFKELRAQKGDDILSFVNKDIYDELSRFYNRYGNLSDKKMAEHIVKESEFLIGI